MQAHAGDFGWQKFKKKKWRNKNEHVLQNILPKHPKKDKK